MSPIGRLKLVSTMIHEIPQGKWIKGGESQITYSRAPTPLNLKTDRFLREEMLEPSLAAARQVVEVDPPPSPVTALVRAVLGDSKLLAKNSKLIAKHMHATQTGGSSAGVFMASLANEDGRPRFIILKAEHQEGVRLKHTGSGSSVVFEVEHLTELIMGQNSKVYKIAMFRLNKKDGKLYGSMVDKQNGSNFADYFLDDFLGCELTDRAEVQTEIFVKGLNRIANDPTLSTEKRARYATAAVAYLESPTTKIKPSKFLVEFIDADDRDRFAETFLAEVRGQEFAKDLTLVRNQIGGLKMKISGGVTISATQEALSNGAVVIEPEAADGPRVVVKGIPEGFEMSRPPR